MNVNNRNLSLGHATLLALVSSIVTAAVVHWWERRAFFGTKDDEFEAGQSQPTSANQTHVPYRHERLTMNRIRRRSLRLLQNCQQRRTLRFFSSDPVPPEIILTCLQTACTAPSGAHKQPWTFVAISNPQIKQKIREMVEQEETINYNSRMRKSWVEDLKPMMNQLHDNIDNLSSHKKETSSTTGTKQDDPPSTSTQKPYLTEAPWLIAVFKQIHGPVDPKTGKKEDHYYVNESVGIACGLLIVALHNANLVTLTSTPMGAEKGIRELLGRPNREKLFLLMPVGFPAAHATVPYRYH